MQVIAVSFSLRDQPVEKILEKLKEIRGSFYGEALLIHGNLPKEEVLKKELPTTLVDGLREIFPLQLNLWKDGSALREEMGWFAKTLKAAAVVIGRKDGHVAEEISIYQKNGIEIKYIPLED